jgi:ribonuclease P protein component
VQRRYRLSRSRLKRRLREAWRSLLEDVPPARDYVLIARPGLAEAVDARGFDWLRDRIREIVSKASA